MIQKLFPLPSTQPQVGLVAQVGSQKCIVGLTYLFLQ